MNNENEDFYEELNDLFATMKIAAIWIAVSLLTIGLLCFALS